jgi:hypothetical protein
MDVLDDLFSLQGVHRASPPHQGEAIVNDKKERIGTI